MWKWISNTANPTGSTAMQNWFGVASSWGVTFGTLLSWKAESSEQFKWRLSNFALVECFGNSLCLSDNNLLLSR